MRLHRHAAETLTAVELDRGDRLDFTRRDGVCVPIRLAATSAEVLQTSLAEPKVETRGARTELAFSMTLEIAGARHEFRREVSTRASFYEPFEAAGLRLWPDAVDDLFEFLNETHGACRPRKHARLAVQDAVLRVCPPTVLPWCPLAEEGLDIRECYAENDTWLGAYFGASAHGGLDVNHPRGTPIWAPIDLDDQWLFHTREREGNHRWRAVRAWPDGSRWTLQTHHVVRLTVPEHTPVPAGTLVARGAGVAVGSHDHSHFEFSVTPPDGEAIQLDPWILFWQMYRDRGRHPDDDPRFYRRADTGVHRGLYVDTDPGDADDVATATARPRRVVVDPDVPGGNGLLQRIEGDTVHIRQDLRDTDGHWFYWHFRVRGAAGRTLRFEFDDRNAIGVHGPAFSVDGGATWAWGGAEAIRDGTAFVHAFGDADDVRFAVGVPYVRSDLDRWLATHADDDRLVRDTLCTSRGGASVPLLRIDPARNAPRGVLLTCRHHCCEAMAGFVLEGLVDGVLGDDDLPRAVRLAAIPMVDYDGVQAGDQGKNRRPHDHNRDYIDRPIYSETRAIRRLVTGRSDGPPDVWIDLHCPWVRGSDCNQMVYQVGAARPETWERQRRFGRLLEATHHGELPYRATDDLPFGRMWNVAKNEGGLCKSTRWGGEHAGVPLATTLEVPYADAHGVRVTPANARELGRSLAATLKAYFGLGQPRAAEEARRA